VRARREGGGGELCLIGSQTTGVHRLRTGEGDGAEQGVAVEELDRTDLGRNPRRRLIGLLFRCLLRFGFSNVHRNQEGVKLVLQVAARTVTVTATL